MTAASLWRFATVCLVSLLVAACSTQRAASPSAEEAHIVRGSELYVAHGQECHGNEAGQGGIAAAPPHNAEGHTWHHPDALLTEWILTGKPFTAMPPFDDRLTEADAEALLAYIKTWWTDDQRAQQADVSERYQEALDSQTQAP